MTREACKLSNEHAPDLTPHIYDYTAPEND